MIPNLKLYAIAAASLVLFAAGWTVNGWRKDATISELQSSFDNERARAEREYSKSLEVANAKTKVWQDNAHESDRIANELTQKINVADRAAAYAALRLRNETASFTARLNSLSAGSATASVSVARAASDALGECGERLVGVATAHDRCEVDRRTLIGAWPR